MNDSVAEYLMIGNDFSDLEIALFDLNEHGILNKLHIARDAFEAMAYLFGEDGSLRFPSPKAIFVDLHMRKISGLDFARRIKANEHTKGIPIVVLKSTISPLEVNECQQLGVKEFLAKPLTYDDFVNIIKNI